MWGHIFLKNYFHVAKILFETADGMAPIVAPCHPLSQKIFAVSLNLPFFTEMKIPSASLKLGHGNICILIKASTGLTAFAYHANMARVWLCEQ